MDPTTPTPGYMLPPTPRTSVYCCISAVFTEGYRHISLIHITTLLPLTIIGTLRLSLIIQVVQKLKSYQHRIIALHRNVFNVFLENVKDQHLLWCFLKLFWCWIYDLFIENTKMHILSTIRYCLCCRFSFWFRFVFSSFINLNIRLCQSYHLW